MRMTPSSAGARQGTPYWTQSMKCAISALKLWVNWNCAPPPAGVMLMNLDYWRMHDIANKVVVWGRENNDRIQFPDQDAINYICRDVKLLLPLKYDIVDGFFQDAYYYQNYPQELRECVESPIIIHYAGQAPWVVEISNHLLQDEWERYNKLLSKPVRKIYQSRGLLKLKVIIYRLLHPNIRQKIGRQNIIDRLKL